MDSRVELCCHTKMSKMKGINFAEEYINEAIKRNYKQIAITDINSTQSFFEIENYLKSIKYNNYFKIIYGSELRLKKSKDSEKIFTIYIYIKEQKGLKNLYELISKAYRNIVDGIPVIYKNDLIKHRDGLLYASIGKYSEVYQSIDNADINSILNFYDFIGIEPNESNKFTNIRINELCKKLDKILIGTSECYFINKEDYECNEILNFYKNYNNIKVGNNNYFQTTDELINNFNYIENAKEIVINNPKKIADTIDNIKIKKENKFYPKIENSKEIIRAKCYDKAYELYGKSLTKTIKERLELELNSIIKNNYQNIYLISSEIVQKSNKLGYEVGNRGGIGNSFVAYLLGIVRYNPIDYNLPFEIFAGKNYDKEPDIDLNVTKEVREKIISHLQKKYGKDKIIFAGTISALMDRVAAELYDNYIKEKKIKGNLDKNQIIKKLTEIKKATGKHPGGIFIIPEDMDITDFCPTELDDEGLVKTHIDYHKLDNLYKFDILEHGDPAMLHELEKETNTKSSNIDLKDKEVLKMLLHANDSSYPISINGIPDFESNFVKSVIEITKPQNINDLACISALSHGSGTWNYNASDLISDEDKKVDEVISNRADIYNYLLKNGIEKNTAFDITEFIWKGKAKNESNTWEEYKTILRDHNIPEWYIQDAEKIEYIFPKAHAIEYAINAFKIAWYKVYHPKAFYKVYFKEKSNLNINNYYCKRQVKTSLNIEYDLKESNENNKNFNNNDKIRDLQILLEMFERGILKEKKEIKDDYNLINSRAIGDYCRQIKHKFNTEELAVLVFRNNRLSINEKIEKYNDLINNYPDMEVIERINCNHYDSVKTLIKKEIQRLKRLEEKLIKEEKNTIYTWTEYNKTTLKYSSNRDLEHTFRTYKEVMKDIESYIKEYNDTISFTITKTYLDNSKNDIIAEYFVENKKIIFNHIKEKYEDVLDIDMIYLNIPTPFKKGDILITKSKSIRNYGDYNEIFVLDYLSTWRENLSNYLREGNYDSSDMIGYGFYLCDENSIEFIRDHQMDYDCFEYYEGELTGNNRILKDISSFIKGKIELELFVHAYDIFKTEFKNVMPDFYTYEGLKLAGMTERDILKRNRESDKIYNMSKEEKEEYFTNYTDIYEKFDKNEIKQIETNFYNDIYILTVSGKLYKTKFLEKIEPLNDNIKKIYPLDAGNLYKITNQNVILPIEGKSKFSNTDKYLNNGNCKYKKIETSIMHIVALTEDGNVRALCGGYPNLGIIPSNFVDVEDITILKGENGIDTPYIYKDKKYIELYVS